MALKKYQLVKKIPAFTLSILILTNTLPSFSLSKLAHPNEYFNQFGDNAKIAATYVNEVMDKTEDLYILEGDEPSQNELVRFAVQNMGLLKNKVIAAVNNLRFTDVKPTDWYYECVNQMVSRGVMSGYGNGQFGAVDSMTKSQFIKVVLALTDSEQQPAGDPKNGEHLFSYWMARAYSLGVITTTEIPIDPKVWDSPITRKEMALVLSRILEKVCNEPLIENLEPYKPVIKDLHKYSEKYQEAIAQVYAKGMISGYTDKTYGGEDPMTRAQACTVLWRVVDPSKRATPEKEIIEEPILSDLEAHWTDAEFERLVNGLIEGTDGTLDKVLKTKYVSIENGEFRWEETATKSVRLSESHIPDLNNKVYKLIKNLVYNAYINGGSVGIAPKIGSEHNIDQSGIRVSYYTQRAHREDNIIYSPRSWYIDIYPIEQNTTQHTWYHIISAMSYWDLPAVEKENLEIVKNVDWNILVCVSTLVSKEFLKDHVKDSKILEGYEIEPIEEQIFVQALKDIYGSTRINKFYSYIKAYYLKTCRHGIEDIFTTNLNIATPYNVAMADSRWMRFMSFWTEY